MSIAKKAVFYFGQKKMQMNITKEDVFVLWTEP
jgi:hypothetical protein